MLQDVNLGESSHVLSPKTVPSSTVSPPDTHNPQLFAHDTETLVYLPANRGGKGCDLPCRVSSESRLLQTGVKCRPRPLQMIPTEPVRTTAARPGSRLLPAATRRKLVHSGGGFMADQRTEKHGCRTVNAPPSLLLLLPLHHVSPSPPFVPGVCETKRAKEAF